MYIYSSYRGGHVHVITKTFSEHFLMLNIGSLLLISVQFASRPRGVWNNVDITLVGPPLCPMSHKFVGLLR